MPQAWSPSTGKLDKPSVVSPYCGDKTATCHDRAERKRKRENTANACANALKRRAVSFYCMATIYIFPSVTKCLQHLDVAPISVTECSSSIEKYIEAAVRLASTVIRFLSTAKRLANLFVMCPLKEKPCTRSNAKHTAAKLSNSSNAAYLMANSLPASRLRKSSSPNGSASAARQSAKRCKSSRRTA